MDEATWLSSTDPRAMLAWMTTHTHEASRAPRYSDRKLRLFACACVRQVWHLLTDGRSRTAVEVAERFADGDASAEDLSDTWRESTRVAGFCEATLAATRCCLESAPDAATSATQLLGHHHSAAFATLLRELAGNPFAKRVTWTKITGPKSVTTYSHVYLDTSIRTPTVLSLAQAAYQERPGRKCERCHGEGEVDAIGAPGRRSDGRACPSCRGAGRVEDGALDPFRLVLVAEALEEAGCQEEALLRHLRGPDLHVRGCWVLDLVSGLG